MRKTTSGLLRLIIRCTLWLYYCTIYHYHLHIAYIPKNTLRGNVWSSLRSSYKRTMFLLASNIIAAIPRTTSLKNLCVQRSARCDSDNLENIQPSAIYRVVQLSHQALLLSHLTESSILASYCLQSLDDLLIRSTASLARPLYHALAKYSNWKNNLAMKDLPRGLIACARDTIVMHDCPSFDLLLLDSSTAFSTCCDTTKSAYPLLACYLS